RVCAVLVRRTLNSLGPKTSLEQVCAFVIEDSLEFLACHLTVFCWSTGRSDECSRRRRKFCGLPDPAVHGSSTHSRECHEHTVALGWDCGQRRRLSPAFKPSLAHTSSFCQHGPSGRPRRSSSSHQDSSAFLSSPHTVADARRHLAFCVCPPPYRTPLRRHYAPSQ